MAFLTFSVWKYPLHIHCAIWGPGANLLVFFGPGVISDPPSEAKRDKDDEVLRKGMAAFQKEKAALTKRQQQKYPGLLYPGDRTRRPSILAT